MWSTSAFGLFGEHKRKPTRDQS
jgi:transposase-like protein